MTELSKNSQVPQCDKTAVRHSAFSVVKLSNLKKINNEIQF